MSVVLEADSGKTVSKQEVLNPQNHPPERTEVEKSFDYLQNRPTQQVAHVVSGRDEDGSGERFLFDRSNPNSDLLNKGGIYLRMASYHDWPTPIKHIADYMAENGLFFTGKKDKVKCCHCLTEMKASELWKNSEIRKQVCLLDTDEMEDYYPCPYIINRTHTTL